jgi:hypothetical protein
LGTASNKNLPHSTEKVNTQGEKNTGADFSRSGHDYGRGLEPDVSPEDARGVKLPEMLDIARAMGVNVRVFPAGKMKGGAMGAMVQDRKTKKWDRIDVSADLVKKGMGDFTLAHEIGHAVAKQALGGKDALIPTDIVRHYEDAYEISKKVRPFDESKASREDIDYRTSDGEVFADVMALYMINPKMLEREAPGLYKAVRGWKGSPFAEAHKAAMDLYAGGDFAVQEKRMRQTTEGFAKKKEEIQNGAKEKMERGRKSGALSEAWRWAMKTFVDWDSDLALLVRDIKAQGGKITDGENPYLMRKMRAYLDSYKTAYEQDIKNGLKEILGDLNPKAVEDLGLYMMNNRIASGDRSEIFNPQGLTAKAASEQLAHFKKVWGAERFDAVKKAAERFAELRQEYVIPEIEKSGMFSEEFVDKAKDNDNYATFDIVRKLAEEHGDDAVKAITGSGAPVGVHKQT